MPVFLIWLILSETDPSLAAGGELGAFQFLCGAWKIRSVQDAIVRVLGFELVMNLAMGLSLGTLNLPKDAAEGYTPYWGAGCLDGHVMRLH